MDIYDVMESLPDTVAKLGIFVGNNRNKLNKVNTYEAPLPDEEQILEELSDQGFGDEFKYARLRWRDEKGVQIKSFSMTSSRHEETEKGDYFHGALSVLKEMNEKLLEDNRRQAKLQQDTTRFLHDLLKEREELNRSQREELNQAVEDAVAEKAAAVSLDIALQNSQDANKGAWFEPVSQVIFQLGNQLIAKMPTPEISASSLVSHLEKNPSALDAFLEDPALRSLLQERMKAVRTLDASVSKEVIDD
jgi:hypothetical protein